ncbi:MAG: hypothetical protein V7L31_22600 [Nostoc sp.]|uniref:hypothetical protein n=1 Tax=Nostoc sp. TaxID=1180 RepID=UPI002FEF7F07
MASRAPTGVPHVNDNRYEHTISNGARTWNTIILTFDFRLGVLSTPVIAFYFYKALLSE